MHAEELNDLPVPLVARTAVLLATFNGARFLPELLDSLARQTYTQFTLFVRDDGSTDDTLRLLRERAANGTVRFRAVETQTRHIGPRDSFGTLLEHALRDSSEFRYFAFCDQDDWWYPNKIEAQVRAMAQAESHHKGRPILIHSDLALVDESLDLLAPSYRKQQHIDLAPPELRTLLLRNSVVGCATLLNRPLAELALPIPSAAIMHDWWLALLACVSGELRPLHSVHLKYRQHGANNCGAGDATWRRLLSLRHWRRRVLNNDQFSALRPYAQAAALAQRVPDALSAEWRARLALVSDLPHQAPLQRRISVLRSGIVPHDPVRLLGCLLKL